MSETTEVKAETLPDLDDLLQCPVCYEIPKGQIFQCDQGHHVCGRCKKRLDVCPVCRAFFFGTRNYAMEELIANIRKLRAFKLGGKVTTGSGSSESSTPVKETVSDQPETNAAENEESDPPATNQSTLRAPQACKGLFRCLCCKNGNGEKLPASRLLNHLRYYHSPELIEGKSENGEYVQAWHFSTTPGRIVTAVRVSDMGVFFLIIEINSSDSVCAWLSMAAAPWVANEFSYTVTVSGNDREGIFTDCVWSVRSCEGSLKKRGHCLHVNGSNARALIASSSIKAKLTIRRSPPDQLAHETQPRAVMRVANRGNNQEVASTPPHDLEPFLQDLQNDVARLSRAFASLGREANAFVRSEAELRARIENRQPNTGAGDNTDNSADVDSQSSDPSDQQNNTERIHLSRNARRRMRQRLRAALNEVQMPLENMPAPTPRENHPIPVTLGRNRAADGIAVQRQVNVAPPVPPPQAPPVPPPPSGPSNGHPQSDNQTRRNKKNRRQRR